MNIKNFTYRIANQSEWKKKRCIQLQIRIGIGILAAVIVALIIMVLTGHGPFQKYNVDDLDASRPDLDVQLLTVNPYSRPGLANNGVKGIVIHYTANPGATAQQNRDYFESLKDNHKTQVSSHFVIGLDGEIVQCIPTKEIAYASNERNLDTISIECCHPDESGKFTKETYKSMVQLTAWLCLKYDLTEEDVIRHYDITGKICPKYFVENEDAWETFKDDVGKVIKNGVDKDE